MRHLVAKGILESEKSYLHLIEQLVKVCLGFIILRSFSIGFYDINSYSFLYIYDPNLEEV